MERALIYRGRSGMLPIRRLGMATRAVHMRIEVA